MRAVLLRLRRALRLGQRRRWHECGHGTAFKTRWMNDVVYQIACFMMMREPDLALEPCAPSHRHDHRRPRPRDRRHAPAGSAPRRLQFLRHSRRLTVREALLRNAAGRSRRRRASFIPETESGKAVSAARVHIAIYARRSSRRWPCARGCRSCWSACRASTAAGTSCSSACCSMAVSPRTCRPPAELPHRLYEPDQPIHLLEHELSRRAPHVPDGALSRAAAPA